MGRTMDTNVPDRASRDLDEYKSSDELLMVSADEDNLEEK